MRKTKVNELSKHELLNELSCSKLTRYFIIVISLVILGFIVWANYAEIDEVAVAHGSVIPKSRTQKVQSFIGGVVEKINVANGQYVEKGYPLIILDADKSESLLEEAMNKLTILKAEKIRIKSLITGEEPDFSSIKLENPLIAQNELELYNSIARANSLELELLDSQITQLNSAEEQLEIQKKTLINQMKFLDEEIEINTGLLSKGAVSKVRVLKLNRDKSDLNQELLPYDKEILKSKDKVKELEIKKEHTKANIRKGLQEELEDVNHNLYEYNGKSKRYLEENERNMIKSPVSGFIHNLSKFTVGGTVEPNELLMEIIPENPELLIRADVSPIDIGHVKVGQDVDIKMTAFDFSRYGDIDGVIQKISRAATSTIERPQLMNTKEQSIPTYEAIIKPSKDYIFINGVRSSLKPGMAVMVDIKTGKKTLMQYLLKPIFTSLVSSFRER